MATMIRNLYFVFFLFAFTLTYITGNAAEFLFPVNGTVLVQKKIPLVAGQTNNGVAEITFTVPEVELLPNLNSARLIFYSGSSYGMIEAITVHHKTGEEETDVLFGESEVIRSKTKIKGSLTLKPGNHILSIGFEIKDEAPLHQSFRIKMVELDFGTGKKCIVEPDLACVYRPAKIVRAGGQDNCDTYRIPGLVTTNKGTLIAVYDNRYNNSKDLQEDIDVGMSRSTDGGQTWEPMRVIMDMDKWGGRPEQLNGAGDPCVLYDHTTGTLWVAGLWMSGGTPDDMLWWSSKPGISPEETGQFMLTRSTDDGLTWSEPINITQQIKDPEWQLLLQGPGRGITLADGTLVFPAQFKTDTGKKAIDGGQFTSHSTIVYSKDGGTTWHIGAGAKPNTTEAQVVQLPDGSLMLNMRDDRNRIVKDHTNGRAVAVSSDLGKTWSIHPSSNSALPEPNCMASLIAAGVEINGTKHQVLFFSNPTNRELRTDMTIKASLDNGNTWAEEYWTELNELPGFGYSCLTMVDENTVGILYEGTKSLYFQKVPVNDIFKPKYFKLKNR